MQLKSEDRTYPNAIEPILNPLETTLQPGKRTTIWAKSQIYTDNEATGIIQPPPLEEERRRSSHLSSTFINPKQQTYGPN